MLDLQEFAIFSPEASVSFLLSSSVLCVWGLGSISGHGSGATCTEGHVFQGSERGRWAPALTPRDLAMWLQRPSLFGLHF